MIQITTTHLYFILVSTFAIIGWWLAYYENEQRKCLETVSKTATEELIQAQTEDKRKLEESCNNALQSLTDSHKQEIERLAKETSNTIQSLTVSNEANIRDLVKEHETELQDIADLGIAKMKEVEDKYAEILSDNEKTIQLYEEYMTNLTTLIKIAENNINTVDKRGSFDSDDELGDFFKMLKDIKEHLVKFKVEANKPEVKDYYTTADEE